MSIHKQTFLSFVNLFFGLNTKQVECLFDKQIDTLEFDCHSIRNNNHFFFIVSENNYNRGDTNKSESCEINGPVFN